MIAANRIDLKVDYKEKDRAKAVGAKFDGVKKLWFVPPGIDLNTLDPKWLPHDIAPSIACENESIEPQKIKGIALSRLLNEVRGVLGEHFPNSVWIRAEISEISISKGHMYLRLAERTESGQLLAEARGVIWRNQTEFITSKFKEATGEELKSNIKILCEVGIRFDPIYGFTLVVEDIDPAYTLGDLAAKLENIRRQLLEEGISKLNKQLPEPIEFVRIAVISPEDSAGLGDFRRETDSLQNAGLCDFKYFKAVFQGREAVNSISEAIRAVSRENVEMHFDALVVIRGGGAVTDLAWLNELEVARLLCHLPVPVFTGIGHEKDNTILDEISNKRFDTPSKVALHIANSIKDNALVAIESVGKIKSSIRNIIDKERLIIENILNKIEICSQNSINDAREGVSLNIGNVRSSASSSLREVSNQIQLYHKQTQDGIKSSLLNSRKDQNFSMNLIVTSAKHQLGMLTDSLDSHRVAVKRQASKLLLQRSSDLKKEGNSILNEATKALVVASEKSDDLLKFIVGIGPQATLNRGFAIAKDLNDRTIKTRETAIKNEEIVIQFQDGSVRVTNNDFQKEELQ